MTKKVTKCITYSYRGSANAYRFGFKGGCYTVSLVSHNSDGRTPAIGQAGFATWDKAKAYADGLPNEWNIHTMPNPKG